jgi:hypothetical protein
MALVTDKKRRVRLSPTGKLFIGDVTLKSGTDRDLVRSCLASLVPAASAGAGPSPAGR